MKRALLILALLLVAGCGPPEDGSPDPGYHPVPTGVPAPWTAGAAAPGPIPDQ